jgi:hypothetical protein
MGIILLAYGTEVPLDNVVPVTDHHPIASSGLSLIPGTLGTTTPQIDNLLTVYIALADRGGGRPQMASNGRSGFCPHQNPIQPATGRPWCAINERDKLGDDTPSSTPLRSRRTRSTAGPGTTSETMRIRATRRARPDLKGKVTHVLMQAHSVPLQILF